MIMLRFTLLCLAVSFFGTISGQEIIHQEPVGWRGGGIELHTVVDKSGKLHVTFLVNDESLRILLLNQTDNIEKEINIARMHGEEVRGGFNHQRKIYLFCG